MSSASRASPARSAGADWRWQLAHAVREPAALPPALRAGVDQRALDRACARFRMSITPYYLKLIDADDPTDPIRRLAVPSAAELDVRPGALADPIREDAHCKVPGLIRRYPDRALLLVSGECPVYCRHCTRRILGHGRVAALGQAGLERALAYLRSHPEIRDVILSGGDPLVLPTGKIELLLARLRAVPSIEVIRIATRVPVTLPMRITPRLAAVLAAAHPLYVNTHFDHPRELTAEAAVALGRLADAGIPLANQAVLLAGVNDDAPTIEALCRGLLANRVRPYYLFMCDLVAGTEHFRTSLDTGIGIIERLRGRLSGLALPQLVVDLPGGVGKVPVGPDYIVSRKPGRTVFRAPGGALVEYPEIAEGPSESS